MAKPRIKTEISPARDIIPVQRSPYTQQKPLKSERITPTVPLKKKVFEVPGPGAYDVKAEANKAHYFMRAPRDQSNNDDEYKPGPGDYIELSSMIKLSYNTRL
jgi:hypothetical protein